MRVFEVSWGVQGVLGCSAVEPPHSTVVLTASQHCGLASTTQHCGGAAAATQFFSCIHAIRALPPHASSAKGATYSQ